MLLLCIWQPQVHHWCTTSTRTPSTAFSIWTSRWTLDSICMFIKIFFAIWQTQVYLRFGLMLWVKVIIFIRLDCWIVFLTICFTLIQWILRHFFNLLCINGLVRMDVAADDRIPWSFTGFIDVAFPCHIQLYCARFPGNQVCHLVILIDSTCNYISI